MAELLRVYEGDGDSALMEFESGAKGSVEAAANNVLGQLMAGCERGVEPCSLSWVTADVVSSTLVALSCEAFGASDCCMTAMDMRQQGKAIATVAEPTKPQQ